MPRMPRSLGLTLMAAAIAALAACGEGEPPAAATYTGTLTDSAIQGVTYVASPSGKNGVTDASGRFQYQVGDTVSFTLGGFLLGRVTASGTESTVTPLELVASAGLADATEASNAVTNMLVLLQALDVDGNPDNGITIPAEVPAALSNAVTAQLLLDLVKAPATFHGTSTALTTLHAAADSAAGGTAAIPSPETALEHFRDQFFARLEGVYTEANVPGAIVFRFLDDGRYLMSQVGEAEVEGSAFVGWTGVERGQIDWLPTTGEVVLVAEPDLDTNLNWGLSTIRLATGSAEEKITAAFEGDTLVVTSDADPAHPLRLARIPDPDNSLIGTWGLDGTSLDNTHLVFFGNGRYALLDPVGGGECGGPGAEYGSYNLSSAGFLSFSDTLFDSNGCAGRHDPGPNPDITTDDEYFDTPTTVNNDGSISLGTSGGTLFRRDAVLVR